MLDLKNCPVCNADKQHEVRKAPYYRGEREHFSIVECDQCGFWWTNPSPRGEDLAAYYESDDYVSHTDGKGGLMDFVYRLVRSRAINSKLKLLNAVQPDKKMLVDYGAGTGAFLSAALEKGWEAIGFEPSAVARENAAQKGLDLRDPENRLDLKEGSVSAFTLWHVLEHVPDLNETLAFFNSRLRDRGVLIVAVPNHESWDAKHYRSHWAALDVPLHLWHFSKTDAGRLAETHGFSLEEIHNMPFDSFYVSLLSEKILWGKSRLIHAFWQGLKSNIQGANTKNMSSLIYVLRKR